MSFAYCGADDLNQDFKLDFKETLFGHSDMDSLINQLILSLITLNGRLKAIEWNATVRNFVIKVFFKSLELEQMIQRKRNRRSRWLRYQKFLRMKLSCWENFIT